MATESAAQISKGIVETATTIKPVEAVSALAKTTEAPKITIGDKPLNEIQKESAMPGFDAHKMLTDMAQGKIHEGAQPLQNETQTTPQTINENQEPYDAQKAFRNLTFGKTEPSTSTQPKPTETATPQTNEKQTENQTKENPNKAPTPEEVAKNELTSYFSNRIKELQEKMKNPNAYTHEDEGNMAFYKECMEQTQEGKFFEPVFIPEIYDTKIPIAEQSIYERFKRITDDNEKHAELIKETFKDNPTELTKNIEKNKRAGEKAKKIVEAIEKSNPDKAEQAKKVYLEKKEILKKAQTSETPQDENKPPSPDVQKITDIPQDIKDIEKPVGETLKQEPQVEENAEQTDQEKNKDEKAKHTEQLKQMQKITSQLKDLDPKFDTTPEGQDFLNKLAENPNQIEKVSEKFDKVNEQSKAIDDLAKNTGIDGSQLKAFILNQTVQNEIQQLTEKLEKSTQEQAINSDPQKQEENKKDGILLTILKALGILLTTAGAGILAAGKEMQKS